MARHDTVTLEQRVEDALAERMPAVDLLEFGVRGEMMRVVIDHPGGVDHDLCAAVTSVLGDAGLLDDHGAEVWSPGPEPPMRRPEHFRRAIGRRAALGLAGDAGRSSYTGQLLTVDDDGVTLRDDATGEIVELPFAAIRRARMLEEAP
jgi:ribosome maturation factor RimP